MHKKSRILIIEDDTDMVESVRQFLGSRGYETQAAYDTDEGHDMLAREGADLIILDVMFGSEGKSEGFNLLRRLRTEKPFSGIPVLMLTAVNQKRPHFGFSAETDGSFLPADAFLEKPFKPEELYARVEELLRLKVSKWRNWPEES